MLDRNWPFGPLRPLSYEIICCDPPWRYKLRSSKGEKKSAQAHYETMTTEDIAALPVGRLAQGNCLLLLWATAPMLPQALSVMNAWGFAYKSQIIWRKTTVNGKVRMGTGYWVRSMHEQVLIGAIGKPGKFSAFPSVFDGIAREHSRKPEEFYALVEKHTSGLRRADLFSRFIRPGFEGWGNQHDYFNLPAEAS